MNNKRYKYYLLLLFPALMLFSCSQDELPRGSGKTDDAGIFFLATLPTESRSTNTTETNDLHDGFHISAICPEDDALAGNTLDVYFTEQLAKLSEEKPGYFGMFDEQSSEQWMWPTTRHGKQGRLKFFAFYPSREVMRQSAGVESEYFGLLNKSTKLGTAVTYDYRMEKFKVNRDISSHIDFVTATAEGSKRVHGASGVELAFEHQLSRVILKAWGNTVNDIEIAGVRIGRAVVESDFNFAAKPTNFATGDATANGNWVTPQTKDCVQYIFREGDSVVKIGSGSNHSSEATATSIMGNGGWAMVIPADNIGWNHKENATQAQKQGLYFSVLMRVKENDKNKTLLYPYVAGGNLSHSVQTDAMDVIYLSIEKETGKVMTRLYRKKENHKYYTDPGFSNAYTLPEIAEIRNYGWAAIPLTINYRWKPGYQYTYTLDYSGGVGVHDPADPYPGTPIISKILVSVTENKTTWPTVYDFSAGGEIDITDNITIK